MGKESKIRIWKDDLRNMKQPEIIKRTESGRCVIDMEGVTDEETNERAGGTHKTSILSLYTFPSSSGLSVGAKTSSHQRVRSSYSWRRRWCCLTWDELHRQVKHLAVAGFFFGQSVVQRHHLSGGGEDIGFMTLELPPKTGLQCSLTFTVTSPNPVALTVTFWLMEFTWWGRQRWGDWTQVCRVAFVWGRWFLLSWSLWCSGSPCSLCISRGSICRASARPRSRRTPVL